MLARLFCRFWLAQKFLAAEIFRAQIFRRLKFAGFGWRRCNGFCPAASTCSRWEFGSVCSGGSYFRFSLLPRPPDCFLGINSSLPCFLPLRKRLDQRNLGQDSGNTVEWKPAVLWVTDGGRESQNSYNNALNLTLQFVTVRAGARPAPNRPAG